MTTLSDLSRVNAASAAFGWLRTPETYGKLTLERNDTMIVMYFDHGTNMLYSLKFSCPRFTIEFHDDKLVNKALGLISHTNVNIHVDND